MNIQVYEVDGRKVAIIDGQFYAQVLPLTGEQSKPSLPIGKATDAGPVNNTSILDLVKPGRATRKSIDEETRAAIRADIAAGVRTAEIAQKYGVRSPTYTTSEPAR